MTRENSNGRYTSLQITLHWLMALSLLVAYAFIDLRELFPKGSDPREAMKALHFMIGLSVLILFVPRLLLRISTPVPAITPEPPRWQNAASHLLHLALYLLMMIMPILGWLTLSAAGKPIPFFGLQLPGLIGESKDLTELFKEIHETIGEIGYILIGLHIAAALYHHHVQRDNTLTRILPLPKQSIESRD